MQVFDQRGERRVERRDEHLAALGRRQPARGPVVVPRHAVDRDERDAGLDQPAGEQGALAEVCRP